MFPNATRTNLVMTTNLRALIHMSGLRLCTMAQWEIRRLFQLIRHEIFAVSPFLGSFLAPKCVPLGYCDEFKNRDGHCPIRPHKDRVLEAWAEKAAAARAAGRELPQAECRSPGQRLGRDDHSSRSSASVGDEREERLTASSSIARAAGRRPASESSTVIVASRPARGGHARRRG